MAYIASRPADVVCTTDEIANRENIPQPFLRKILPRLAQAGLIQTRRGTGGGIALARPPSEISLYDIIVAMEGPIAFGHHDLRPGECPHDAPCPAHDTLLQIQEGLVQQLRSTNLVGLVTPREAG
jgi:Rrf2 family protein